MKYAIRDDDTSFFTSPNDLKGAYDFIEKGCVSLSIVPYTVPIHKDDVFPYGRDIKFGYYDISRNQELVEYLKKSIANNRYDILLHGYSHEYQVVDGCWKAEMIWKSKDRIKNELTIGKTHLETLFNRQIKVFVAPNNSIDQKAVSTIEQLGMDYSGIIQRNDREINLRYLQNFAKRWGCRAIKKIPYPGILDYGKHRELVAYTLDAFDRLVKEYDACKKKDQPFVIYTHYWQLLEEPSIKELLRNITDFVLEDGAELVGLSKCFGR